MKMKQKWNNTSSDDNNNNNDVIVNLRIERQLQIDGKNATEKETTD